MSKEIFADLVKTKTDDNQEHKYLFFKGDIYPEGTRLVPIVDDEFRAIIKLIARIYEEIEKNR